MFKNNIKNFLAAGVITLALILGALYFDNICDAITKLFQL